MKLQIRQNIFETNSSSVHTLVMCSDKEFNDWKEGKMIFNKYDDELREGTASDIVEEDGDLTFDDFFNDCYKLEFETFHSTYDASNGETIHAFGYFGYSN